MNTLIDFESTKYMHKPGRILASGKSGSIPVVSGFGAFQVISATPLRQINQPAPGKLMDAVIADTALNLDDRSFAIYFSQPDAGDRSEVERFISNVFHQAYGAKIKHFKPCLMSLRDQDNKLVAACGFHNAGVETLFLENYLDRPIEKVISEQTVSSVKRNDIVEVGNFSVAEPGIARYLITAIRTQLHATDKQWAVFVAVPMLRNGFIKMNLNPVILGDADRNLLPAEEKMEWGNYYAHKPQIMALKRIEQRNEHLHEFHPFKPQR